MKKSNNTRINKKLQNFPHETGSTLHLNKSVPTFADFLDLSALNTKVNEASRDQKDLISSLEQNLKPRAHMKAPSKRLALLLDAYSDPHTKKHHYTIDALEASSRETSLRSPQNAGEAKKPLPLKNFGLANSFKTLDFLKSKEFSKLALAKMLGKSSQKPRKMVKEDNDSKEIQGTMESQNVLLTLPNEELERGLSKEIPKRMAKTPYKEDKKSSVNARTNSKSKSKLRKIKVLYTDTSVQEKTVLNNSQPQSTKHRVNICSASLNFNNSGISLLTKTASNQDKQKKERITSSQARLPTASRLPETSNSVHYGDYYSVPVGDNEKHKKNRSSLIARNSENEKIEVKVEPLKGNYMRPPLSGQVSEKNGVSQEVLQTCTTRNPELSDLRLARLPTEKYEDKIKEKITGKDLISVTKLEKAFDTFIEENKHKLIKAKSGQIDLEKMIKAWGVFIETIGVTEEVRPHYNGNSSKKMSSEREVRTLKKEDGSSLGLKLKNGPSISTNHSALPTEKKVLRRDTTIEKCDTEKAVIPKEPMESLQLTMEKQQSTIEALQRKEVKMMKLIRAIEKRGFDVEKIYKEEIKKNSISFLDLFEDHDVSKVESKVDETIVSLPRGDSILSESVEIFSKKSNFSVFNLI